MSTYRKLAQGLKSQQAQLIPSTESVFKKIKTGTDYYISLYEYNEEHLEHFKRNKSVAGLSGLKTKRLLFDFDDSKDINRAKNDAIETCNRLIKNGISDDKIQIAFSGNKGFHVSVVLNEYLTRQEFVNIVFNIAGDLKTFDQRINDEARIIRVPLTKHPKTGLHKIPLTFNELKDMSVKAIQELAKDVNDFDPKDLEDNKYQINTPKSIIDLKNKEYKKIVDKTEVQEEVTFADRPDFNKCPSWLSKDRFALLEGYFYGSESVGQGERNTAFMILAATLKHQGLSKDHALAMLLTTAEKQSKITGDEPFTETDLKYNIINQVYSPTWTGGVFGRDEDLLVKTRERFNLNDETTLPMSLVSIEDVGERFKDFARNFDSNRILTGIKSLDDKVVLTSGMAVGLLGSPGCHAAGTKVLMFDGSTKNVEDVILGDLLMGPDSKPREVLKLIQGKEEMVKIIPKRYDPFTVNRSHILHLAQSKSKNKGRLPGNINITVDNYIKGVSNNTELVKSLKLLKTGVEFSKKELPLDPYLFGTWLGDGSSKDASITTMDEEILDYWKLFAKNNNLNIRSGKNVLEINRELIMCVL